MWFQDLPIPFHANVVSPQYPTVVYPYTCSIFNKQIEQHINHLLYDKTIQLIESQYVFQQTNVFAEMIGTFALKTNEKAVLSVTNTNYAIFPQAAHGLSMMDSITIDVETGHHYTLEQLFKDGSDYVPVLSDLVAQQIENRNIPVFEPFTTIDKNQSYYLADKCLILYFPIYELTPYYYGFPYFPISLYMIEPLLKENIFIQRLLQNN